MNTKKNIVCIQERTTATATIFDAMVNPNEENEILLIWIVDSGPHRGHKIFDRFLQNSPFGLKRFAKMCEGINYHLEYNAETDLQQLVGKRAEILIEYTFSEKRRAWINIIGSYKITSQKAELDPFKPTREDRFYHTYNPKKLPIQDVHKTR